MKLSKKSSAPPSNPSDRYINRELSWLEFNRRVLAEAANNENPLLERLKFLAIFESNLDEFYMVRVSGLAEQHESGLSELTPDGLSPAEQLRLIYAGSLPMRREAGALFESKLRPELAKHGITLTSWANLTTAKQEALRDRFIREIFPICTPLMLHPAISVPFISNRSLNLAVELEDASGKTRLARVKAPSALPRLVRTSQRKHEYILLEDLIANNLQFLFPGVKTLGAYPFRVLRDADIEIRELEAADLISAVEEMTRKRRFGDPVRIDVHPGMPERVYTLLLQLLELDRTDVFMLEGPLGLDFLAEFESDDPTLRFPNFTPYLNESLAQAPGVFDTVDRTDVLLHHPFDAFAPIERFVASACDDPRTIGIKQTLYRVGSQSPIVESLLRAAESNKQVAVMVELKARFDESNNLTWARALERAGAHVSYGFHDLKTHCKLCLVVRREGGELRSYAHVGTGNYNPVTARLYTDFGLIVDDPEITQDVAELFNYLTGYSQQSGYRKLLVAPVNLREGILSRIDREVAIHKKKGGGRIVFKLNSLVDPEVIDALYDASNAGVDIDLIVRGICCLRPGVPDLSSRIRVTSVVGRFLEHSRAYYFENGGAPELFIGSADLMRRNLDRRIEALVPVESAHLVSTFKTNALDPYLRDNVRSWNLGPNGVYTRRAPESPKKRFSVQDWLIENPTSKLILQRLKAKVPKKGTR